VQFVSNSFFGSERSGKPPCRVPCLCPCRDVPAGCQQNVAVHYLINFRRKTPVRSGSITVFFGSIASSKLGGEAKLVQPGILRARIFHPVSWSEKGILRPGVSLPLPFVVAKKTGKRLPGYHHHRRSGGPGASRTPDRCKKIQFFFQAIHLRMTSALRGGAGRAPLPG
jgi:hypothetical protein